MSASYPTPITPQTQAALDLKANKANALLTGSLNVVSDADESILTVNDEVISPGVPIAVQPLEIGDGDDTQLTRLTASVTYNRTDEADLIVHAIGDVNQGQPLTISNLSANPFEVTAQASASFFNGSAGVVDSLTCAIGETIELKAIDNKWRVVSRYTSAGGGDALTSEPLSQFAETTSDQLRGVLSNPTGTGQAVFGTAPTLDSPAIVNDPTIAGTLAVFDYDAITLLFSVDNLGVNFFKPLLEKLLVINNGDSTTIPPDVGLVQYKRADAQAVVMPVIGSDEAPGGRRILIASTIASSLVIGAAAGNSFYDNGVVSSVTIAAREAILFVLFPNEWRVVARYASNSGGSTPTTTEGDLIVRGPSVDQRLAIGTAGQALRVNPLVSGKNQWVGDPYYDAVLVYGASGLSATTTGSITASTASLVVASAAGYAVGHGIFVAGAGAAGANLVTTINAIAGTTITLATNAGTTVSGVLVQHDDTAAINAALAAAFNAGGGTVLLRAGHYRCNKALDVTTNSILTFPQDEQYGLGPRRVELIGASRGRSNVYLTDSGGFLVAADGTPFPGGVVIDCRNAPAGTGSFPAIISGAPYLEQPTVDFTGWNNLDLFIDKVMLLTKADSTLSGIQGSNILRLGVGGAVMLFAIDNTGEFVEPTSENIGIFWPQQQNNVGLDFGPATIMGFGVGTRIHEHTRLYRPEIRFCGVGLQQGFGYHLNSGNVCIESCPVQIQAISSQGFIDLVLEGEATTGEWYSTTAGLDDPSNVLRGRLAYCHFVFGGGTDEFIVDGGTGLISLTNLRGAPPASTWTLEGGYTEVSISAVNSIPPSNAQAYIARKTANDSFGGNLQLTGQVVWVAGSATARQFALLLRGTSIAPFSGATAYMFLIDSGNSVPGCYIGKVIAGSVTPLTSAVNPGDLDPGEGYKLIFTAKAGVLTAAIQRVSDSKWLTSGGTWQTGAADVASVSDGSIGTGSAQYGVLTYANNAGGPQATITNFGAIAAP